MSDPMTHQPTPIEGWRPTPRDAAGNPVTNGSSPGGRYKTVSEGVTPYPAHIGDHTYFLTRRPPASVQLALTRVRSEQMQPEHADIIADVLRSMLPEGADTQVAEILDLLDLQEVARLINDAATVMKPPGGPPTTGPSASPSGPTPTASATGSPAPVSNPQTSTG